MTKNILITGGAGFIGCNCAKYYIENGDNVYVFDNLSRPGSEKNIEWLEETGRFEFIKGDVADISQIENVFVFYIIRLFSLGKRKKSWITYT